ncbi:MAG: hypothetical protein IT464_11675 [Planctomycetes bacterium]|nr:hypothetical protein [Planctomycetota bacterium]
MDQLEVVALTEALWLRAEAILAEMYLTVHEDEDGDRVPFHLHTYGYIVIRHIEQLMDLFHEMQQLLAGANMKPAAPLNSFRDFLRVLEARPK